MTRDFLILSRVLHYAALFLIFGFGFFALYAFPARDAEAGWRLRVRFRPFIFATSLLALVSGAGWFVFTSASMAGSLSEGLKVETLRSVISDTDFGLVWSIHLALLVGLAAATAFVRPGRPVLLTALAGVCLASVAATGHTQIQEGANRVIHAGADAIHLLAAGAWLGGLLPLGIILAQPAEGNVTEILSRFSRMGYAAVAALIATGAVNSFYILSSASELIKTLYGEVLMLKLGLFVFMLSLACVNRFWLVPGLSAETVHGNAALLYRLRLHVLGEQLLGIAIITLVGILGTLSPHGN